MKTMEGKKVLITGGLGFIGSNLASKCVQLGAKVTIFDCLDPRSGGNLFNITKISDSIQVSYHNILDFDQVSQVVPEKDIIFSCAFKKKYNLLSFLRIIIIYFSGPHCFIFLKN